MPAETKLAKLAAAVSKYGGGQGGLPELTWDDVAGAMPSNRLQSRMLRLKWGGYDGEFQAVVDEVIGVFHAREEWGYSHHGLSRLAAIVGLAVDEWLSPGLCKKCHGKIGADDGFSVVKTASGAMVACDLCGGTGMGSKYSDRARKRLSGIHRRAWDNCWGRRFDIVMSFLQEQECIGLRYVGVKLSH